MGGKKRNLFRCRTIGILTLFAINSMALGAKLTLTPQELSQKKTGDSFAVNCQVDLAGADLIEDQRPQWKKVESGGETLIPTAGRVSQRQGGGGTGRLSVMLILENAEKEDTGTYKCVFGEDFATIPVSLFRSITFGDTPVEQHPTTGQDAVIKCRADADPKPFTSWAKNGQSLGDVEGDRYSVSDEGDLTIKNFDTDKDDGIYKCEALQKETGLLKTLEINVVGYIPPSSVTIILADEQKWKKGVHEDAVNVRLTCTAAGVPTPAIKWSRNDADLAVGEEYDIPASGVLEIKKMTPDKVGTYRCVATNEVGKDEKDIALEIYLKPQITKFDETPSIVFGDDFSSECKYSGADPLTAIWTKNGAQVTERPAPEGTDADGTTEASGDSEKQNERYVVQKDKNAVLYIKSATLDDAGEYMCSVTNDAASNSSTLKLEVKKAPTITSFTQGKVRAVTGTGYTIFCEVHAVPDPTCTWTKKDGAEIKNQEGQFEISKDGNNCSLKITPVIDDDFGIYVCKADNQVEPPAQQSIELMRIEQPYQPVLNCDVDASKPTSISLKIDTFSSTQEEHKRPSKVDIVLVAKSGGEEITSNYEFAHDGVYKITKLAPSTIYIVNVTGQNEAGTSASSLVECTTKDPTPPGKPVFTHENPLRCAVAECPVEWNVDDTGGKDITKYIIEYRAIAKEGEAQEYTYMERSTTSNRYVFDNLQSATTYDVKVKAVNSEGAGEHSEIMVIAPDESRQIGGESWNSPAGPSTGAIVGIVVIIVLIIVVLVDVACYYVNQCGLLMCICVNICGKTSPDVKAKEVMMEEGGGKETRFEERQEKIPLRDEHEPVATEKTITLEVDASESTPMIEMEKHQEIKINTVV